MIHDTLNKLATPIGTGIRRPTERSLAMAKAQARISTHFLISQLSYHIAGLVEKVAEGNGMELSSDMHSIILANEIVRNTPRPVEFCIDAAKILRKVQDYNQENDIAATPEKVPAVDWAGCVHFAETQALLDTNTVNIYDRFDDRALTQRSLYKAGKRIRNLITQEGGIDAVTVDKFIRIETAAMNDSGEATPEADEIRRNVVRLFYYMRGWLRDKNVAVPGNDATTHALRLMAATGGIVPGVQER